AMGSSSLGEYLYHERFLRGKSTRLKLVAETDAKPKSKSKSKSKSQSTTYDPDQNSNIERNLYALRRMVIEEFEQIWVTQARFHPQLQGEKGDRIRQSFRDTLFYQRPLKSVAGMVRPCPLEPTLPHAPKAQLAFQNFRIEKTLADLRFGVGKQARPLSPEQKAVIRDLCQKQETVSFRTILAELEEAGCPKPPDYRGLNLESANRAELKGNQTLATWRSLGQEWEAQFLALDTKTQVSLINFLADITPEIFESDDWLDQLERFKGKTDPETAEKRAKHQQLIEFVEALRRHEKFNRLSAMGFPSGRANYSVKALNRLSATMAEQGCDEEAAITLCYPQASTRRAADSAPVLPSVTSLAAAPPTGNATVDMALRQIRIAVNEIIAELGRPPSEIVIEMTRDMSLGPKARNLREAEIGKNQNRRTEAKKEIIKANLHPSDTRIRKYLWWQEQKGEFCPYCDQTISFEQAMSADTEIEHIIPKKLTQVRRKRSELVLAHRDCNAEKGDRTPFQAWGNSDRFENVKKAAKHFDKTKQERKAKLLLLEDYEAEVLTDESINGFADRQFHQTGWIAKAAIQWMEPLCPGRVSPSRGEMTALLRANWGLNTVIAEDRLANGRKVLDKGGKFDPETKKPLLPREITPADFTRLRKGWEGHRFSDEEKEAIKSQDPNFDFDRQIDKRIDHRHHI
ncbi:MAG: HNH endonuclease, partial [Alphaproteobacteria bacterium]|nr:HNH endonuclease [Alphaproteobacteria bacterium]